MTTHPVLLAQAAFDAACDAWQAARTAERTAERAVDFARAVWEDAAKAHKRGGVVTRVGGRDEDYALGYLLFTIERDHPGYVRSVADREPGPITAGLARFAALAEGKPS